MVDKQSMGSVRGGARSGAGRKKGSGAFGEPTKVMRVPESKVTLIKKLLAMQTEQAVKPPLSLFKNSDLKIQQPANDAQTVLLPWYGHKVVAGFPSPAEDYIEDRIDLNEQLIRNKEASFLLTVQGSSMQDAGIKDGDIIVVDRSITPADGKIVIAAVNGELTVKRLSIRANGTWLMPENDQYQPLLVTEESDMVIWGVVTATISRF